jgi:hypothetical protein
MKEYIDKLKEIETLVELSIGTTMTEEKATDIYAVTNDLMCKVKKLNISDVIISTKKLNKYDRSRYNGEIINNISITDDGGVIVETENNKKKFYTYNQQDIIDNVDGYRADYNICMIQDEDGINVSKY